MYDCVIIGMGCAGMSAGIYAVRSGLKTLIIDNDAPGGLLNKVSIVENYLGFKSISGSDLAYQMYEHVKNENVEFRREKALKIIDNSEYKTIITTKGEINTKNIIISIGRKLKKSGLPNEEKFIGKGISYCAICDAPLYKDKKLVVLGGGDSAFEEAIYLSKFTSNIKILVRKEISASDILVEEAKNKNIEIIFGTEAKEFNGNDKLESILLKDGSVLECDGVFIYYGYNADTSFISNLNICDEKGYILVDSKMKTNIDGIYACGDIIKKDVYQIVTAVSEGAVAALSIKDNLK